MRDNITKRVREDFGVSKGVTENPAGTQEESWFGAGRS